MRVLAAALAMAALSLSACVSAAQREADEIRAYETQRESWDLVAVDGQDLPAEMPNGQKVDRGSLVFVGPEFPKDVLISFRYAGLRRSPRNPNRYRGRIAEPEPAGLGRMQALIFRLVAVEDSPEDYGEYTTPLDEDSVITFVDHRAWVTIGGHMMVFRKRDVAARSD